MVIGDHAHFCVHRNGGAVEQFELFAWFAPAHLQATVDLVQIKNVRRPAELEHHIVGDVHQRRNAALAATGQTVHHPAGRSNPRIHATHNPSAEAPAEVFGLHLNSQSVT